jgi:hypothetical protein
MKKIILGVVVFLGFAGLVYTATMRHLNFHRTISLVGASHRIVVVANPTAITGGVIIVDETYTLVGGTSTIHTSISVMVE